MIFNPERTQPDAAGFFGRFGGSFISETLAQAVEELRLAYFHYRNDPDFLVEFQAELAAAVQDETRRQEDHVELIALENYVSPLVMAIQQQVIRNARAMAAVLQQRGYQVVSGGTDNHMMLMDFSARPYTGKDADAALANAYITANKNAVPNDPRPPFVTTRGFGVAECEMLAGWLCDVLDALESGVLEKVTDQVREQVVALCRRYPVYQQNEA